MWDSTCQSLDKTCLPTMLLTDEEFPSTNNSLPTFYKRKKKRQIRQKCSCSTDNQVSNSNSELERKEIKQKSQKSVEICLNLDIYKPLYKGN